MSDPSFPAAVAGGMHALRQGAGPALVLVHGALGDCRQWAPIAAALADRFDVWSLSRRHHWPAPAPSAEALYTVDRQAEDLIAFLDSLDAPATVVGHSYGTAVALDAATRVPERVARLVLIEPAHAALLPAIDDDLQREIDDRGRMLAGMHADLAAGRAEDAAIRLIDWVQGGPGGFAALPVATQAQLLANAATLAPAYAHPVAPLSPEQLARVAMPVLAVVGGNTRRYYRACAEGAVAMLADARMASIHGASHMLTVERPLELAQALGRFEAAPVGTR
jgi:pimeloyl-ACP methyl ester carboxylesterase